MDYGCIYQGGYIFAIDDLTSTSTSIGGKVLATSEQSQALLWGDTLDKFEGIDENSTSGANSCNGATDGLCNSRRILASGLKPPAAVKACEQLNDSGFNGWYLPAICEMGYDTYNHSSHCGSKANPSLQNFTSTLYDNKRANMPVAEYWSSTQFSGAPDFAWLHFTLNSGQDYEFKKFDYQVRCVRHLSNEK